jgi:hypothetical protein
MVQPVTRSSSAVNLGSTHTDPFRIDDRDDSPGPKPSADDRAGTTHVVITQSTIDGRWTEGYWLSGNSVRRRDADDFASSAMNAWN